VAEKWPGPVVYYATDLTFAYDGLDPAQVNELDRRMCSVARAVCPNSRRIAEYFIQKASCDPKKIAVIPNATRDSNIAAQPLLVPGPLPPAIDGLSRPIAGVIGNLSANMDWLFLAESIRLTPELRWVFVGPTSMGINDSAQREARRWVMGSATFVGSKPYGELQRYARAFDVAILPYKKKEPTYSGSSTRFYEHLSACRPMIATRGFAELLEKTPLVTLVDTAPELAAAIAELHPKGFSDGLETDRWEASRLATWHKRAAAVIAAVG
jgi:glycosyltransferase involved in cell wall biosynthesis